MDNYKELKTYISNKIYEPVTETNKEVINVLDIVKVIERDMERILKAQKLAKLIEDQEYKKIFFKRLKNKVKNNMTPLENVTINIESTKGLSKIIIGFPQENVVCIFRGFADYDIFLKGEIVENNNSYQYIKDIIFRHLKDFVAILESLNLYTAKYNIDIANGHLLTKKEKALIQTINSFPFIIDIFIDENFQVACKTSFFKEVDKNNILDEEINRRVPLSYYIENNGENFIKRFFIPREELNRCLESDFINPRVKVR